MLTPSLYPKINSKQTKDPPIRLQTKKLLEENREKQFKMQSTGEPSGIASIEQNRTSKKTKTEQIDVFRRRERFTNCSSDKD